MYKDHDLEDEYTGMRNKDAIKSWVDSLVLHKKRMNKKSQKRNHNKIINNSEWIKNLVNTMFSKRTKRTKKSSNRTSNRTSNRNTKRTLTKRNTKRTLTKRNTKRTQTKRNTKRTQRTQPNRNSKRNTNSGINYN